MAITWTPIEEGDALSANSLNAQFADVRTGVNSLLPEYVKERSLSDKHLPSTVIEAKSVRSESVSGHYYGYIYPGHGVDTSPPGADNIGWQVLGEAKPAFTNQSITFDTAHDLDSSDVRGILVMANVNTQHIYDQQAGVDVSNPTAKLFAHFMVQVGLATSTAGSIASWVGIWASERYTHADTRNGIDGNLTLANGTQKLLNGTTVYHMGEGAVGASDSTLDIIESGLTVADLKSYSDVSIRLFLDENNSDLTGTKYVRGIRVVVSTLAEIRGTDETPGHTATNPVVYVGEANLSAIVFQAGGE